MNRTRKSLVLLLTAWLVIMGHVAVAMPFCQMARPDGKAPAAEQNRAHTSRSASAAAQTDQAPEGCPKHNGQNTGGLACDDCALCHMAGSAVPSAIAQLPAVLPSTTYDTALPSNFLSFDPEQPQPVPLAQRA